MKYKNTHTHIIIITLSSNLFFDSDTFLQTNAVCYLSLLDSLIHWHVAWHYPAVVNCFQDHTGHENYHSMKI